MPLTIVCPQCVEYRRQRQVMRFIKFLDGAAHFVCDTCACTRIVTNDKLGLPLSHGPGKPARGKGFGPGPARYHPVR